MKEKKTEHTIYNGKKYRLRTSFEHRTSSFSQWPPSGDTDVCIALTDCAAFGSQISQASNTSAWKNSSRELSKRIENKLHAIRKREGKIIDKKSSVMWIYNYLYLFHLPWGFLCFRISFLLPMKKNHLLPFQLFKRYSTP